MDPAAGAVQRFAYDLRQLRQEAGGLTYRKLAARCAYSVTTLSQAAAGERLPSLEVALAYAQACGGDPVEWEHRWHEAVAAAEPARDDASRPPYRGLSRFEPADHAHFFGRGRLTSDLVALAHTRRFAAVFGPSGSGKSSLLRAGLIPALQASTATPPGDRPPPPPKRPGREPPPRAPHPNRKAADDRPTGGADRACTAPAGASGAEGDGRAAVPRADGAAVGDPPKAVGDRSARGADRAGTAVPAPAGGSGTGRGNGAGPQAGAAGAAEYRAAQGQPPGRAGRSGTEPRAAERAAEAVAALRLLTPGPHPYRTHAEALEPAGGNGETWLFVDQFEEVFTLCQDQEQRVRFLDALLTARDPGSRLRVVIAVRADFYGRCAEHPALAEALHGANLLVGPMTPAELREAIVKPAAAQSLIVERALTARLLTELEGEPGALPLMSHVLLETWRRRRGRALTLEAYEAVGGLHGAVAVTAEEAYAGFTAQQAEVARRVLLRLIAPGEGSQDTRRPADRAELAAGSDADVAFVLERLAHARLLTLDEDTVELAHEALITGWPRLRAWIEADRERLRALRRLTEAAATWEELDRDPGALYRGSRLAAAEELFAEPESRPRGPVHRPRGPVHRPRRPVHRPRRPVHRPRGLVRRPGKPVLAHQPGKPALIRRPRKPVRSTAPLSPDLTPREKEFLRAALSARSRERTRLRALTAALCTLLVVALVAGVVAWQQNRQQDEEHVRAEARRIAAVADSLRFSDPVRAMRLSLAAWRLAHTPETHAALLGAYAQKEESAFTVPDGGDPGAQRFLSADGRTVVSAGERRVTRWDITHHRRLATYPGIGEPAGDAGLSVSPDGGSLALQKDSGLLVHPLSGDGRAAPLRVAAFGAFSTYSDSGRILIADTGLDDAPSGVQVWDVPHRKRLFTRPLPDDGSYAAAVSPDDRLAALCVEGRPLEVWDVRSAHRRPLPSAWRTGAPRGICRADALRFTPDGKAIAAVDHAGLRVYDIATGHLRLRIKHGGLGDTVFSADGSLFAAADSDEILVWRTGSPRAPVYRYPLVNEYAADLRFTHDGTLRYLGGVSGNVVRTLSLRGALTTGWGKDALVTAVFSADGSRYAAVRTHGREMEPRVYDSRTGRPLAVHPRVPCPDTSAECVPALALSPDGRMLAYAAGPSLDGTQRVTLWDVRRDRPLASRRAIPHGQEERLNEVNALAFAPDGRSLLLSRIPEPERTEVWDTRLAHRHRLLRRVGGQILAPSPGGRYLATDSGQIADLRTGRVVRRMLTQGMPTAFAYAPHGRTLAAGDDSGRVTLWDGRARRSEGVLPGTYDDARGGTTEPAAALSFSPDGAVLAVAGGEGTLHLWDTATRQPLGGPLPTPGDALLALSFSPDGSRVYAVGAHTGLRVYPVGPSLVRRVVCERAGGGLSRADWARYVSGVGYRGSC